MKGESRLIARGDLELLTYETEEDVRKLEEELAANQTAAPKPGEYAKANQPRMRASQACWQCGHVALTLRRLPLQWAH